MAGHGKHGAQWCSGEITGGGNSKMRSYLDSKCLAKWWRLKHGTRWSYWHDRLENGAAMAVSECSKTHGGDGNDGAAAWQVRGKASESERARNGLSTMSPHFSPRCGPTSRANADI